MTSATGSSTVTINDETSTASTQYPLFSGVTTGTTTTVKTSSTKLTYQPSTGTLTALDVQGSSDERLKTNWRDLPPDFLELLSQVKNGVFDRIEEDMTQMGVSAQSLREAAPHGVGQNPDTGMLSVSYGNVALVAVIKLINRVLELEEKVRKIEGMK